MKYALYWVSRDRDSSSLIAKFKTREEAEAAIDAAWQQMRDQGPDDDIPWINEGSIEIEEREGEQ